MTVNRAIFQLFGIITGYNTGLVAVIDFYAVAINNIDIVNILNCQSRLKRPITNINIAAVQDVYPVARTMTNALVHSVIDSAVLLRAPESQSVSILADYISSAIRAASVNDYILLVSPCL